MADYVPVKVSGLKELREALLTTIPEELRRGAVQKALSSGSKVFVDEAKIRAPVMTGTLRKSIYQFVFRRGSSVDLMQRAVGVRSGKRWAKKNKDAFYWKFVEFGHRIGHRGTGKLQRHGQGKGSLSAGEVPARPFMRPAFEAKKLDAIEAFRIRLTAEIERIAEKVKGQSVVR